MNSPERIITNYHTHTVFCDGANTPEEMVLSAIGKRFAVLGFSGHALYPFSSVWHTAANQYDAYCTEIRRLAAVYAEKITVKLGFEADFFPMLSVPDMNCYRQFNPDYLIGSVHFVCNPDARRNPAEKHYGLPGACFTVDGSVSEVADGLKLVFNGNGKKAVQTYFALQREMIKNCTFNIVGHMDLIRKQNAALHFFDETDGWYVRELEATARVLAATDKIAEINTGGIARGTIQDTYPSATFLRILHKHRVPVIISADAHSADALDCAFDYALKNAAEAGYTGQEIIRTL